MLGMASSDDGHHLFDAVELYGSSPSIPRQDVGVPKVFDVSLTKGLLVNTFRLLLPREDLFCLGIALFHQQVVLVKHLT